MSILAVHEHPDGSYTVKDGCGHVVHTDAVDALDIDPDDAVVMGAIDDASLGGDVMVESGDALFYRTFSRRKRRPNAPGPRGQRGRKASAK